MLLMTDSTSNLGTRATPQGNRWSRLVPSELSSTFALLLLVTLPLTTFGGDAQSPTTAPSQNGSASSDDQEAHKLAQLSLEELMAVRVTSVSKRDQSIADAPAAIYVLTQSDIQRSGATTIADALRTVPGLQVAQQNRYDYAITSRGFEDLFANKLLVMIDGRSVYTPLFSGTYWQVQDTVLEDIDRIEIVRGPGATLWGANAVNGVINIITKNAKDTQGTLLSVGAGSQEQGFATVRYGGKLGEKLFYRVYGKYFDHDSTYLPNNTRAEDKFNMWRGGYRLDWEPSTANTFTLQGDAYAGEMNSLGTYTDTTGGGLTPVSIRLPFVMSGQNVLGRWKHEQSEDARLELQMYFDRTHQAQPRLLETRNTFDIDLQQSFQLGNRNQFIVGGGYRVSSDHLSDNFDISFTKRHRSLQLFSAFIQDELILVPDRLRLTLGSKFEHNDFTGFETQPSARLIWTPTPHHSVWTAMSRAVRTPSRAERDVRLNFVVDPAPAVLSIVGNPQLRSEELIAYELGYRVQPCQKLSLDVTAFYNAYDHMRIVPFFSSGLDPSIPAAALVNIVRMGNFSQGEVYGSEFSATWNPTDFWRLRPSYSYLSIRMHRDAGVGDASDESEEKASPTHQFSLQSSIDFPAHVQWDTIVRYMDRIQSPNIPAYTALDMRLSWRPKPWMEWTIVGQNLLDDRHPEFKPTVFNTQTTEIPRSVFGKLTLRF